MNRQRGKKDSFEFLSRQQFRAYFQPTRIVIGVFRAPTSSGFNPITLCFHSYISYKPVMMSVAIHSVNATFDLIKSCTDFTLSVFGESLADEAMYFGTKSMRDTDKFEDANLTFLNSLKIETPGVREAIANIELTTVNLHSYGDHDLVIGKVENFSVNPRVDEKPLLSIGPRLEGYKLLKNKGIHRIGIAH